MAAERPGLYGLVGHPVSHSRSPFIHHRFAEQTGQRIEFLLIDVPPGKFEAALGRFRERGGRGLNVTLPYKGEAFDYADRLTDRARLAAAVNTLAWRENGEVLGDNTDGAGLIADLGSNLAVPLKDRRILLMGAGGAARGALGPLAAARPAAIVIANRSVPRAEGLAERFDGTVPVSASAYEDLDGAFDLVINATSASLEGAVPPLPEGILGPETFCYDMMYQAGPTAFCAWATEHGAGGVADGVGMLVEQAAESFDLWRGVRPDTGPVLEEIRRELT